LYYVVDKRDIKFEKGAKILVSFCLTQTCLNVKNFTFDKIKSENNFISEKHFSYGYVKSPTVYDVLNWFSKDELSNIKT
jgi:hypothetical protein